MMQYIFQEAKPVWIKGKEVEKNLQLSFKTILKKKMKTILRLACSTVYRVFVNGSLVAIGPARTAAGFYKVDILDLTKHMNDGKNAIVIEVTGYNINSTYTLNQPSFLTAEIEQRGDIIAFTGSDAFQCKIFNERVQKVQRYSYQRPFTECYRLTDNTQNFRTNCTLDESLECNGVFENLTVMDEKYYLRRDVRYPEYEILPVSKVEAVGIADFTYISDNIKEDRSYTDISETLLGYRKEELEEHLSTTFQNIAFKKYNSNPSKKQNYKFEDNDYKLFSFPYNATGLIAFDVKCNSSSNVYVLFDELLINDDIDTIRMECCNGIKLMLNEGVHPFITFEPYTLKYLKLIVQGSCEINNIRMIEYKHPTVPYKVKLPSDNLRLKLIYDAALESFRANAVDVLTDCPSRERVGWLCDSYFTGRVEKCLTGENVLERSFLENFIIAKKFEFLPEGMLPMSYPSDHYDGVFIPNWAMWFVLELEEYYKRNSDSEMVDDAKKIVYGLLNYLSTFENELGLLEKLESWIFVEWSKAADFVQDVNYPTNMLYSKMLQTVSELYDDNECLMKAQKIRKVIVERSFNGQFFTDNEIRKEGKLYNPNNTTEVCQYYALFTGIATPNTYPKLWQTLLLEFGPERKLKNNYPEVHFANAFIGNYLRIEMLYKYGEWEKVLQNIEGYFWGMAKKTGTLWEYDTATASCNHGFASHIIYWLAGIYGIEKSDNSSK